MSNQAKEHRGSLLPRISVTRPVTVTMCLVALLVVGIVALTRIPMQAFPSGLEQKQLWVWVSSQENTSTKENDEQISQPMVEYLQGVKGLRLLWSSCGTWGANARLEFRNDVDMALAYGQVVDAVERLKLALPREVRDNVRIWNRSYILDEPTQDDLDSVRQADIQSAYCFFLRGRFFFVSSGGSLPAPTMRCNTFSGVRGYRLICRSLRGFWPFSATIILSCNELSASPL